VGEIVGAGVVAHVPPIMVPADRRAALNDGRDTTLVAGLARLRAEVLDRLRPDTVVIVDTHWFTTQEHIVTAHERRAGRFTSEELPTVITGVGYDAPGDPELARAVEAAAADRDDTWVLASDDPHLPIHYATVNLLEHLQGDERWVSTGVCQTADAEDFLRFGEVLAAAVTGLDRRVVLLGSGGLSHRFWPLREFRDHEGFGPEHIRTPEARAADEAVLASWAAGDHAAVIDGYEDYRQFGPEARFGHYLTVVGALGGRRCRAPGVRFSDYEASAGTGQVHVWFERPEGGWTA
jgi:aromatic ring-opening dioxygenase catalytic subunit (LigB family)